MAEATGYQNHEPMRERQPKVYWLTPASAGRLTVVSPLGAKRRIEAPGKRRP